LIEPGSPLEIEACGETFESVVLSRRQQRSLVSLVKESAKLDEKSVESVDRLYDIIDQIVDICLPNASDETKDRLQISDVLEIAGVALTANVLDSVSKKKSESPPT